MVEQRTEDKGFRRRPKILDYLGMGGMEEADAHGYADAQVRDTRSREGRWTEGPAPDPEVVRERRESRRLREARQEN